MTAFTFLRLNGMECRAPEPSFERLVRHIATGAADKNKAALFFRRHGRPG